MNRPPSPPPDLPGYQHVQHIGGGGFADVFLYEQQSLGRRRVAVKVLTASASSPSVRAQFDAESSLMAALSTHPHIVTIYDAAIAADGRPYLVMEYCSRPNLSERYKSERIGVADVVSIGVQIGGAIETAHRAGILHRDIKPANLLTTDIGWPALTDFGISVAATGGVGDGNTVALSIPWSPPEMLSDDPEGDQRADVYSLSATLYTLLARRSPYERPTGSNTAVDLVTRIQRSPLPALGRSDVPPTLERVLARGLAKAPAGRWNSALQVVRALQDVQSEQGWPVTEVALMAEDPGAAQAEMAPEDDGRTRIRGFTVIHAQAPVEPTSRRPSAPNAPVAPEVEGTQLRARAPSANFLQLDRPVPPPPADTVLRQQPAEIPTAEPIPAPKRWPWLIAAVVAVVVVAGVVIVVLTRGTAPATLPSDQQPSTGPTGQAIDVGVPEPVDLAVRRSSGTLIFTWRDPDPKPGDSFQWQRTDTDTTQNAQTATSPTAIVRDSRACIQVILVRDNGRFSDPARLCSKGG